MSAPEAPGAGDLVSSTRQTARGPAATRTLAAQGTGYKNGQNREVPETGRKIHLSLILGLNGAAKSHFGPI